ncbi:MAG: Molybdopterin synthase sulfur carrier subunit [Chloroflexi bacterium]|nr:Molybdopterin synthase sulfur carrier subunit [Chloroflexota bacterium]
MIKVNVLFFASIRSLLKKKNAKVELPEGAHVRDLKSEIIAQHPELERAIQAALAAVNHEFSNDETKLEDGDEVAFFSHVSGG